MPMLDNQRHELFAQALAAGKSAEEASKSVGIVLGRFGSLPRRYYVYLLVDPIDGRVFYVGKGLRKRYSAHWREWRTGKIVNAHKYARMRAIARAGKTPEAYLFRDNLSEDQAYDLERALIQAIGLRNLTNAARGQSSRTAKLHQQVTDDLSRMVDFRVWAKSKPRTPEEAQMFIDVVCEMSTLRVSLEQEMAA